MFDLDDFVDIFVPGSSCSTRSVCREDPVMDRETRKKIEHVAKEISEPLGDIIEVGNNVIDTYENVEDTLKGKHRQIPLLSKLFPGPKPSKGDHIFVQRTLYSHHGIYENINRVYQYDMDNGVEVVSLEDFADGDIVKIYVEKAYYSSDKIIERAKSRVGEDEYNLLYNNCQNFATWCRQGS